ncbi:MAG TPA: DUF1028 domain-containing protein [Actinomycetes bacterium]
MTFSIIARDPETGDLGGAVQSKFLGVDGVVLHGRAGTGMVATQAWANVSYGRRGLALLEAGASARQALDVLVGGDDQPGQRQAAVLDGAGRVAAHTGGECPDWAGHHTGDGVSCQGNILVSGATVEAMAAAFREGAGLPFPERLVAALDAGQAAGGDARGQQSAALLVVREGGGYGGGSDRLVDLRVDDHATPIAELGRLLALHRRYFQRPRDDELAELAGPLAAEVAGHLARRGAGPADPGDAAALWQAVAAWAGLENLEERLVRPGWVDPVTLEVLREG